MLEKIVQAIAVQEGWHLVGNPLPRRNNNPGNLKFGPRARRFGAQKKDKQGHAIFPTPEDGWDALRSLIITKDGQTLRHIGKTYAEDPNWARGVSMISGVGLDDPLNFGESPRKVVMSKSRSIDELDARCGTSSCSPSSCPGSIAYTQWGPFTDDLTRLYLPFFCNQGVSLRAGTILHESRHADGKGHDSGNNDSSWGYNGAWRWQVCWLAWFAFEGTNTSMAMRTQATQRANNIINNNFDTHPGSNV